MTDTTASRKVYCVLSARSLPYARHCLESLLERSLEVLDLRLVTDDESDRIALSGALGEMTVPRRHRVTVHAKAEADDLAAKRFAGLPNLQGFRLGHPCWRKITDPMLFAAPGEEMVLLDPDLYFPNRFRFEPTPATGLLLMWQKPSCLLPHETVMSAYRSGVRLAHHVDIGVSHARNDMDLHWLDHLIGVLGGKDLPRAMHVEAIVWAALAMRVGGGHLDPSHWHCWHNPHWKKLVQVLRVPGPLLLRAENFRGMKCFHGGGPAKWWIAPTVEAGRMPVATDVLESRPPAPFEELTRAAYLKTHRWKSIARGMGLYSLLRH